MSYLMEPVNSIRTSAIGILVLRIIYLHVHWSILLIQREIAGLIHATFSLNPNWPYDWSEFLPNQVPQFQTDGNLSVLENETLVFDESTATDADNDSLTYKIEYGDDSKLFELNSTSGVLRFITAKDFESPEDNNTDNVYQLTVSVSDGEANLTLNLHISVANDTTHLTAEKISQTVTSNQDLSSCYSKYDFLGWCNRGEPKQHQCQHWYYSWWYSG